ncbi:MAG TPA: hypothetical protein VGH08_11995 [Chthoniobacterales bacterium]
MKFEAAAVLFYQGGDYRATGFGQRPVIWESPYRTRPAQSTEGGSSPGEQVKVES